jgi:hypothetical protein
VLHNEKETIFYDAPNFFIDTKRIAGDWLQKFKDHCARRFHIPVQIDVSVLDKDTVKLVVMPASIHQELCEDFNMHYEDGNRYIRSRGGEEVNWPSNKDKERNKLVPFVQFRKGEATKYPWHVLDEVGGLFIVEGRDPVNLTPLITSYKWRRRLVGKYYIVTRKVPIGTAVVNVFIDYKDKHVPYERGGSYLRFNYPSYINQEIDE